MLRPRLQVRLFDNNLSLPTLIEELTERVDGLQFSTGLHGGFKRCGFFIGMDIAEAWQWLSDSGRKGYHFNRLTIHEEKTVVWEGRIMDVQLEVSRRALGIRVTAFGYWNACRDQFYDAADGGNTDWTAGGPHTVDDIIKEMLTNECPDINTNQANIVANSRDVVGLDLTDRDYPQNIIVEKLAPLSDSDDSIWFFAIWDDRKPYWDKRSVSTVDWYVWLDVMQDLQLKQAATNLRNAITPVVDGTEGTVQTDANSLVLYPRRELLLTLPKGANSNSQTDGADLAAAERANPKQSQRFVVDGRMYQSVSGSLVDTPKWRVRAGDVLRIQDLVPASVSSPSLDDLRTFFIRETNYEADRDVLTIQPDTAGRGLVSLLPRLGKVERDK